MTNNTLPSHVTLLDVGPRDGLQNEAQPVDARDKIELVHRLQAAGLSQIEVTSYVSPKWVPQMADNAQVMAGITRQRGVRYSALTPNMKGFEGALVGQADEVAIFAAASEAFSQRNINCSVAESIERFKPVVAAARANGMRVRAAVSCALGCPYQGEVTVGAVVDVIQRLIDIGVDHIGVADTIGVGTAGRVKAVMAAALKHVPVAELSGHFHDTYGQALTNIYACLELGIHTFDTSVAGLGGCPYAKGATGNVATEDVVYLLNGLGITTGIDLDKLVDAGAFISGVLGRKPVSRVSNALLAKRIQTN
ncbi:MAG: hydroxymethylglutaryl-CoA lyase [Aquabacterium sp.]|nr:hydroxymethylglutaryl-CoA lyase [Aquabacterium sp.]